MNAIYIFDLIAVNAIVVTDSTVTSSWLDRAIEIAPFLMLCLGIATAVVTIVVIPAIRTIFRAGALVKTVGQTEKRVEIIEKDVSDVKKDVKDIHSNALPDLNRLMTSILRATMGADVLESHSPRGLTPKGNDYLEKSGVKDVVNSRFDDILSKVKAESPKNAYQAESAVIKVVRSLDSDSSALTTVQEGAFNLGVDVELIWLIGAIYIRDRILIKLDFKPEDIDKDVK